MNDNIVIPNQFRAVDPYIRRISHFDTQDSQIYLSRATNKLIKNIGNDIVIDGLHPTLIEYNKETKILNVSLCGGILIQDFTFVEIWEHIHLSFDVSPYDLEKGYFLIHTDFAYLKTPVENDFGFFLQYIDMIGDNVQPFGWNFDRNRIYLLLLKYDTNTEQFGISYHNIIHIKNKKYFFRGFVNFNLAKLTYEIIKHHNLYIIYDIEILDRLPPVETGEIEKEKANQVLAQNANLLVSANRNLNPMFLMNDVLVLIDYALPHYKYNIFHNMGNIFTRDLDPNEEILYTKNPNIDDIGKVPMYERNKYKLIKVWHNLVLTLPDNIVPECDKEEESIFDPKYFIMEG